MQLDRDNIRHLTGFGRDMANYIQGIEDHMNSRSQIDFGVLHVLYNSDTDQYSWETSPSVEGQPKFMLIHVLRGDRREITVIPTRMFHPDCRPRYHIYQHTFVRDENDALIDGATYTGVTGRGWRTRWAEHFRAANSGSHYRFHAAIRQWHDTAKLIVHAVVHFASSEERAMEIEEAWVAKDSLYPLGLNMIPGGNAGLAYLRTIGALGTKERVSVDDRQAVINRFFERATRKGLPNPLAAANWLDPSYAEKVICAGPDRLKAQQIRDARFLSSLGHDANSITTQVGARNVEQIQRLLDGTTYGRIL